MHPTPSSVDHGAVPTTELQSIPKISCVLGKHYLSYISQAGTYNPISSALLSGDVPIEGIAEDRIVRLWQ
ncbi:hypothetical protein E4T56_gene1481 [Termitomyces sp. T112]|nr:hypothetical protein E4T56_gene1481 [Termitomyces sp. T112]